MKWMQDCARKAHLLTPTALVDLRQPKLVLRPSQATGAAGVSTYQGHTPPKPVPSVRLGFLRKLLGAWPLIAFIDTCSWVAEATAVAGVFRFIITEVGPSRSGRWAKQPGASVGVKWRRADGQKSPAVMPTERLTANGPSSQPGWVGIEGDRCTSLTLSGPLNLT